MLSSTLTAAAVLLQLSTLVTAHGHGHDASMDTGNMSNASAQAHSPFLADDVWNMASYAGLSEQSGSMLGHVVFMVIAWFFALPIGECFRLNYSFVG
jgi:hypothetical protein